MRTFFFNFFIRSSESESSDDETGSSGSSANESEIESDETTVEITWDDFIANLKTIPMGSNKRVNAAKISKVCFVYFCSIVLEYDRCFVTTFFSH